MKDSEKLNNNQTNIDSSEVERILGAVPSFYERGVETAKGASWNGGAKAVKK